MAEQALAEYGRTGNHADYETALEFQVYVNQQLSDFDPTSIIQIDLAKQLRNTCYIWMNGTKQNTAWLPIRLWI
ncbi:hypothetical protein [Weissella confusa]|uniref:hypothetical protein n=1 Tax=Weissella confusa TaxID=1583 RepID=UPI00223BD8AF|nr:hypothetical protein [Weissella confusa]